jgi:hypothetical protein
MIWRSSSKLVAANVSLSTLALIALFPSRATFLSSKKAPEDAKWFDSRWMLVRTLCLVDQ